MSAWQRARARFGTPVAMVALLAACGGSDGTRTVSSAEALRPTTCFTAQPLDLGPGVVTVAGQTGRVPSRACGQGGSSWYTFTLSVPTAVYADTFGSDIDAAVGILPASCLAAALACGDPACGTSQSQIVQTLDPGTYHLVVAGRADRETGPFVLHLEAAEVPGAAQGEVPPGDFSLGGAFTSFTGADYCSSIAPYQWWWYASCPGESGPFSAAVDATVSTFGTGLSHVDVESGEETCSTEIGAGTLELTESPTPGLRLLRVGLPGLAHVPSDAHYRVTGHRP